MSASMFLSTTNHESGPLPYGETACQVGCSNGVTFEVSSARFAGFRGIKRQARFTIFTLSGILLTI